MTSGLRVEKPRTYLTNSQLSPHMRQEACLLTQLYVYSDFTSHPPAALAALLIKKSPSFFHFLICSPSPPVVKIPVILRCLHISSSSSSSCASCSCVRLFPPPSHPSSINSLSPLSLSHPSRLLAPFPWLFWQPSVELIHELVPRQCNQALFVAHYQLPGAGLFHRSTMVFCCVIVQLSLTQGD